MGAGIDERLDEFFADFGVVAELGGGAAEFGGGFLRLALVGKNLREGEAGGFVAGSE